MKVNLLKYFQLFFLAVKMPKAKAQSKKRKV